MDLYVETLSSDKINDYLALNKFPELREQTKFFDTESCFRGDYQFVCVFDKDVVDKSGDHPIVALSKYAIYGDAERYVGNNYYTVAAPYIGKGISSMLMANDLKIKIRMTKEIMDSGDRVEIKLHNYYDFSSLAMMSIKDKVLSNIKSLIKEFPEATVHPTISGSSADTLDQEIIEALRLKSDIQSIPIFGTIGGIEIMRQSGFSRNVSHIYQTRHGDCEDDVIEDSVRRISKKEDHFFYILSYLEDSSHKYSNPRKIEVENVEYITYKIVEYRAGYGIRSSDLSLPVKCNCSSIDYDNLEASFNFGFGDGVPFGDIDFSIDKDMGSSSIAMMLYHYYKDDFDRSVNLGVLSSKKGIKRNHTI